MGRPNLKVATGCQANRIMLSGRRATGVEDVAGGRKSLVTAEAEVIVTAGAIGTPKLMILSGIRPAKHLEEVGVKIVHDLPAVGENLTDQFGIDIVAELNGDYSLDKYKRLHWMLWAGAEYLLFKSGPVTSNVVEGGAFWYSGNSCSVPDLQFHFLTVQVRRKAFQVFPRARLESPSTPTTRGRKAEAG